jgi:photosystem II stability/assembly factor-like uncharacterized protein
MSQDFYDNNWASSLMTRGQINLYTISMMKNKLFLSTTSGGVARASQEGDKWKVDLMLEDQDVRCLVSDPLNPDNLYVGTQGRGVLRSKDRGKTWQAAGMDGQLVKSLAVSPHQPGTLYAGIKPASVFVSHNYGEQWTELEGFRKVRGRRFWLSPAEPPDFRAYVQGLSISPTDPNIVVAGIEFGAVVRSEDGGKTWSNHRKGALRDCHSLTFHCSNGNWVYEGGGGGAALSRDGGITWHQPKAGRDRHYGWACAADPERPEVWYMSASPMMSRSLQPAAHVDGQANAAIYRSAGGAAWERLSGGLPEPLNHMAYALLTDPSASGHLYAGMSSGDIWHTTDYGDSWQQLPVNFGGIHRSLIMIDEN